MSTDLKAPPFDLDMLHAAGFREWVPFTLRYGYQRISDFARKTEHWPAVPGRLWELTAHPKGIKQ